MRLLREPLFHFFLLGAAIFAWYELATPEAPAEAEAAIVVDPGDVERLIAQYGTTWRRPPNEAELDRLIEAQIREEILVREARKLGLDRGDSVVRSRLAQKMIFLTTSVAQALQPDDATLAQFLDENPDSFRTPATVAFEQVFLGADPKPGLVDEALAALAAGADPVTLGERSLLPAALPPTVARGIDGIFGRDFAAALLALPVGEWAGPVASGYGQHLVRVTESTPGTVPPLDDIREQVVNEWRRATADELTKAQYESLRAQYQIETPDLADFRESLRQ